VQARHPATFGTNSGGPFLAFRANNNFGQVIAVVAVAAMLGATALLATAIEASANACASNCRAQHNQCRIATKGSSSCDTRLQQCLQRCLRR
jgi:hypothetical protein